jgi:hypothetical protein
VLGPLVDVKPCAQSNITSTFYRRIVSHGHRNLERLLRMTRT